MNVGVGRFDPLVGYGLECVLGMDPNIRVVDWNPAKPAAPTNQDLPRVVIVAETADCSARRKLIESGGIVMLVRAPTVACGMVLMEAGVSCLALSATAEDVLAAVRVAAVGGCLFVDAAGDRVERQNRRERLLTDREVDVLRRLAGGMSYGEIADEFEIGVATVSKHARSLIGKLRASSRRELAGLPTKWLS